MLDVFKVVMNNEAVLVLNNIGDKSKDYVPNIIEGKLFFSKNGW